MFARGRSPRAYRVYAEDDFLEVDDPDFEADTGGDPTVDSARPYTVASRGLRGPLGGRAGLMLVVLVAMAVSALVAHALRAGIGGGGEVPPASTAPPVAAATPARVPDQRPPAGRAPGVLRRAGGFSVVLRATARDARTRARRAAGERTSGSRPAVSDWLGSRASATATGDDDGDAASESSAAAVPEFGFER
jgi:hypothetical protein